MAGGNLPFGLAPSGSMTSYTPTLREKAADWMRRTMFSDDRAGQRRAEKVMDVASMTPFGFGLDAYDAGREAGMGNLGGAGLMLGMTGVPGPSPKRLGAAGQVAESFDDAIVSSMAKKTSSPQSNPHSMANALAKMIDDAGIGKFEFDGEVYKTTSIDHSKAPGSISTYLHFEAPNGEIATVRISDHSNAPDMGSVRREGSRQEVPSIDLRVGDNMDDVVARLRAFFDGTLRPDAAGRLPQLKRPEVD